MTRHFRLNYSINSLNTDMTYQYISQPHQITTSCLHTTFNGTVGIKTSNKKVFSSNTFEEQKETFKNKNPTNYIKQLILKHDNIPILMGVQISSKQIGGRKMRTKDISPHLAERPMCKIKVNTFLMNKSKNCTFPVTYTTPCILFLFIISINSLLKIMWYCQLKNHRKHLELIQCQEK